VKVAQISSNLYCWVQSTERNQPRVIRGLRTSCDRQKIVNFLAILDK
jgi:hypothetical protein